MPISHFSALVGVYMKKIYLNYTTMNACSEDVTAWRTSPPFSVSILVPV